MGHTRPQQRTLFTGLTNVVQFNWHFYLLALASLCLLVLASSYVDGLWDTVILSLGFALFGMVSLSLLVTWYVYDLSGIYRFDWLHNCMPKAATPKAHIANIHAGFDETSELLQKRFPQASLSIMDFYDPRLHTEISIKRARRKYPPHAQTVEIQSSRIPLANATVQIGFVVFAAHEIRDDAERVAFFEELRRVIDTSGRIVVVEHLRDLPNFLAYFIGAFHFLSRRTWINTFRAAKFSVKNEMKLNPFVVCFVLEK